MGIGSRDRRPVASRHRGGWNSRLCIRSTLGKRRLVVCDRPGLSVCTFRCAGVIERTKCERGPSTRHVGRRQPCRRQPSVSRECSATPGSHRNCQPHRWPKASQAGKRSAKAASDTSDNWVSRVASRHARHRDTASNAIYFPKGTNMTLVVGPNTTLRHSGLGRARRWPR